MNWHYLYLFAQVYVLELAVLWLWFRHHLTPSRRLTLVLLANAFTHPIVFFGLMHLPGPYLTDIALSEVFAFVAEAMIYQFAGVPGLKAWCGSLSANLLSWQIGPILTALVFLRDRLG
jgi:hypothetical protein